MSSPANIPPHRKELVPSFEQRIKRAIRKRGNTEEAKRNNPVLEKDKYIQPSYWLWPKIIDHHHGFHGETIIAYTCVQLTASV